MNQNTPLIAAVENALKATLAPCILTIQDDSARHATHARSNPHKGAHLILHITSPVFAGKTSLQRQRLVHACLAPFFQNKKLHAVQLVLEAKSV